MPLPRPCERCSKRFQPGGTRLNRLCDDCSLTAKKKRIDKIKSTKYFSMHRRVGCRKNLNKYYRFVKRCVKCGGVYGSDMPNDVKLCPLCVSTKWLHIFK